MTPTPRITRARFVLGAAREDQFPAWELGEVAFGGRSNVGKSSLLRVLAGNRRLVRVSRTPGRTQEVNFFEVNFGGTDCGFVDLPGYGYARVPGAIKDRWGRTVERYVSKRPQLVAFVLLVDSRRGPEGEEEDLIGMLGERGCPVLPVYTKLDKLPKTKQQGVLLGHQRALGLRGKPLGFSALTGEGKEDVMSRLGRYVLPRPEAEKTGEEAPEARAPLPPEEA